MQSCITGSQRVRRACRCYERVEHTQYVINVHGNVGVRKGPADSLGREPLLEGSPGDGLLSLLAPFSSLSSTCSPGACSSPRGKPRRPGSCALDSQVPGELRNPLLVLRDSCRSWSVGLSSSHP